jgi:lipoate-protein ligase B
MIDVCVELRVNATPHPHRPGVVCRTEQLGWIASGVRNWITQHGLFLNVAPAMHLMRLVTGTATGIGPTSLAAQTSRPVSMHTTREHLVRHLAAQLGYDNWHIYTGHPLLGRTRKMVHVPA